MQERSRWVVWLAASLIVAAACSRDGGAGTRDGVSDSSTKGNDAAIPVVRAGARALAEPGASVDLVAAQMEGAIAVRTKSQALMRYDGYRVTLTTPGEQVTRITFDLPEARPTVAQLTKVFGKPEEIRRGMMYEYYAEATGATIQILAEPVSLPATETSLVKRILIEGKKLR